MKYQFSLFWLFLLLTGPSIASAQAPDLSGTTEDGLIIEIYSQLSPLRINQIHAWHVRVLDSAGEKMDVQQLTFIGGMPEHDHGLPTQPQITAQLDNGDYLLEGIRFHMQGKWQLLIELEKNGVADSATIDFTLQ